MTPSAVKMATAIRAKIVASVMTRREAENAASRGTSANQIAELNGYAASLTEVVIDTTKVLRIDFAFASAFFDVVKGTQLAGKRVILSNMNELNAGLLEAFGFNRYAILVRKKSI